MAGLLLHHYVGLTRGGSSSSYDEWTVDDLRDRATELGIEGRSKMDKDELIDALRNH